jgi:hypothetical protein
MSDVSHLMFGENVSPVYNCQNLRVIIDVSEVVKVYSWSRESYGYVIL